MNLLTDANENCDSESWFEIALFRLKKHQEFFEKLLCFKKKRMLIDRNPLTVNDVLKKSVNRSQLILPIRYDQAEGGKVILFFFRGGSIYITYRTSCSYKEGTASFFSSPPWGASGAPTRCKICVRHYSRQGPSEAGSMCWGILLREDPPTKEGA